MAAFNAVFPILAGKVDARHCRSSTRGAPTLRLPAPYEALLEARERLHFRCTAALTGASLLGMLLPALRETAPWCCPPSTA